MLKLREFLFSLHSFGKYMLKGNNTIYLSNEKCWHGNTFILLMLKSKGAWIKINVLSWNILSHLPIIKTYLLIILFQRYTKICLSIQIILMNKYLFLLNMSFTSIVYYKSKYSLRTFDVNKKEEIQWFLMYISNCYQENVFVRDKIVLMFQNINEEQNVKDQWFV